MADLNALVDQLSELTQEDQRHQGSPRHHQPRPDRSEGSRRGRAEGCQGRRVEGRSREAQEAARRSRRDRRDQV